MRAQEQEAAEAVVAAEAKAKRLASEREQAEKARVEQEEVSAVLRAQQEPKIRRVDSTMAEEKQREREVYERQVSAPPHSADPHTALHLVTGSRSTHPV